MTTGNNSSYDDWPMTRLLDAVESAATGSDSSVRIADILSEIGDRSIAPMILVVALLLVSPLSAVPGFPTLGALSIILLTAQAIAGRNRLWLPGFVRRATLRAGTVERAVGWLRRPAHFVDLVSRPRLSVLTCGPARLFVFACSAIIALGWPALELLPGVTSLGGLVVGMMAFGLFARDGYFVLAGFSLGLLFAVFGFTTVRAVI